MHSYRSALCGVLCVKISWQERIRTGAARGRAALAGLWAKGRQLWASPRLRTVFFWGVVGLSVLALARRDADLDYPLSGIPQATLSEEQQPVLLEQVAPAEIAGTVVPEVETVLEPPTAEDTSSEVVDVMAFLPVFDPHEALIPVQGEIIRTPGWYRHPEYGDWRNSPGIQIRSDESQPAVRSSYTGVVAKVSKAHDGGWDVVLTHRDGWVSEYRGLEEVTVEPQQYVEQGTQLGTSQHELSFVLRRGETPVDPGPFLARR